MGQQNAVDGSVTINLGGREITLAVTGRAVRLILEQTGLDLYQNIRDVVTPSAKYTTKVIWALSQNAHNGNAEEWPTIEDVENSDAGLDGLTEAMQGIALALTPKAQRKQMGNALKEAREKVEQAPKPPDTSTSEASAASS